MAAIASAPDVIVVGSGPAGVSAAWPLVEASRNVVMLEAGTAKPAPPAERPTLAQVRGNPATWPELLGERLQALRSVPDVSPKVRTAAGTEFTGRFLEANSLSIENFAAVGVLMIGGLSGLWGAGASMFDDDDTRGWPISMDDLAASYRAVSTRIGISGVEDDDLAASHGKGVLLDPPVQLSALAQALLAAYERKRDQMSIRMGRMRQAVLTRARDHRGACTLDNFCMWGCARRAIWHAMYDLETMRQKAGFELRESALVRRLRRVEPNWVVESVDRKGMVTEHAAPIVIIAAGTLATTRLALATLGRFDRAVRLHSTPAFGFALLQPGRIGKPLEQRGFGLGQLAIKLPFKGGHYAFGTLFHGDSISAGDIAASMPFSRAGALTITRLLLPALVIGLIYLPSAFSDSKARLVRSADGSGRLVVQGAVRPEAQPTARSLLRRIGRDLARLGLYRLPGSTVAYPPGSESHHAGTLPMGETTTRAGEIIGAPGLYVADGSALPNLPAKHHTLTVMANADRIGRHVLAQLG
jgi:choline dehydrogenase-like flavoprotein